MTSSRISEVVSVESPDSTGAHSILIVDDNREIQNDYRRVLRPDVPDVKGLEALEEELFGDAQVEPPVSILDFEIDAALQGEEGLRLLEAKMTRGHRYSMAFVDMRMPPGWDGLQTVEKLWTVDPDLHVVICSAYSDRTWKEIIGRLGSSDKLLILKKPFDNAEVLQMASTTCRKADLERASRRVAAELESQVAAKTEELTIANRKLQEEMDRRAAVEVNLRLAQKLESVGQLASGIAHEINTPVQFISDSVHFLKGGVQSLTVLVDGIRELVGESAATEDLSKKLACLEEEADWSYTVEQIPEAFSLIDDGIERVSTIVGAMKEFAHPDSRSKTSVDLNRSIETTLVVAKNEYRYVATIDTALGDIPLVPCHAGDINQLILNLVVNASHAIAEDFEEGQEKGCIRVSTEADGDCVLLKISDTGCGIPKEIRDRVFDPFFTTKPVGKGTGQGLAIARSVVVDKHGGTIELSSEPGAGTEFSIRLPIEAEGETA